MLDWLKKILGDGYTEEIDKKVSEEIGKGFVARADFNAANEAKKAADAQLKEANKAIEGFKALDIDGIKKAAEEYRAKAEQAQKDADARVAAVQRDAVIDGAILKARGRNAKAVRALLDMDALAKSTDLSKDVDAALAALAKDNAYLFEDGETPPPYAPGTGTAPVGKTAKYTGAAAAFAAGAGLNIE